MHRAAQCLLGTHDFHSFETEWPNRSSSVRTVSHVAVCRAIGAEIFSAHAISASPAEGPLRNDSSVAGPFVCLEVESDGFLYNMVRAIAGTLYNVGRGFWPEEKVREVLTAQDRRQAGPTAPPQGLFLVRVEY
jgi:tRNA pseudouridine38-40 synthase